MLSRLGSLVPRSGPRWAWMFVTWILRNRWKLLPLLLLWGAYVYIRKEEERLWKLAEDLPPHWQYNIAQWHTPDRLKPLMRWYLPFPSEEKPPLYIPEVERGTWAGGWDIPSLSPPQYTPDQRDPSSPAFLMLHVFSTSRRGARIRRELIRNHSPWDAIPPEYRHLVEIKFVLGQQRALTPEQAASDDGKVLLEEQAEEENKIKEEMDKYGDIIRLQDLQGGDNMNNGKSLEWVRWVGRQGGRQALWVLKCDDDTLPIMPNLLSYLATQNPHRPTYFGSSIGRWTGYPFYFEGMMYGFSWGVVKTLATLDVTKEFLQELNHEDVWMGLIMTNLPPYPLCPHRLWRWSTGLSLGRKVRITPRVAPEGPPHQCVLEQLPFLTPPPSGVGGTPASPDPRTGLVRLDIGPRLGQWESFAIPKTAESIGWHNVKTDELYVEAYQHVHELFKEKGREYMWKPPKVFEAYAQRDSM